METISSPGKTIKVHDSDMVGLETLWAVLFECDSDAVFLDALEFLTSLHLHSHSTSQSFSSASNNPHSSPASTALPVSLLTESFGDSFGSSTHDENAGSTDAVNILREEFVRRCMVGLQHGLSPYTPRLIRRCILSLHKLMSSVPRIDSDLDTSLVDSAAGDSLRHRFVFDLFYIVSLCNEIFTLTTSATTLISST